ncbi:MAG: protein kinase domain-containing protein [Pseudanabaenaceae cyanobacterium]
MATPEVSPLIGKVLDHRYRIVRVLAAGGFGHTYLAEDTRRPNCPLCVVKQLQPSSTEPGMQAMALRLFQREAEILEQMGSHPQIPRLLAYFEEEGEFYIVQQYIDGLPLTAELSPHRKWAENRVRDFLREMLEILSFVHSKGVIHRDVKPSNILRQKSDGKLFLIDFGAIKQLQSPSTTQAVLTSATISIGTPGYMAIEQGMGKPRPASDIYGLGTTALHAVTGIHPSNLREDEDGELVWQPFTEHLSPELKIFLNKMVRSHFKERFKDGAEALEALLELPPLAVYVDVLVPEPSSAPPPRQDITMLAQSQTVADVCAPTADTAIEDSTQKQQSVAAAPLAIAPALPPARKLPALAWLAIPLLAGLGWWGWHTYQQQQLYATEQVILQELTQLQATANYEQCLAKQHEFKTELGSKFQEIQESCRQQLTGIRLQQARDLLKQQKFNDAIALAQTIPHPESKQIIKESQLQQARQLLQQQKFTDAIALAQQVNDPDSRAIVAQAAIQIARQVSNALDKQQDPDTIENQFNNLPTSYQGYDTLKSRVTSYRQKWEKEKDTVARIKQASQAGRWRVVIGLANQLTIPKWQQAVAADRARADRELAVQFELPVRTPPRRTLLRETSPPPPPSYSPPPPPPPPGDRPPALDAAN